MNISKKVRTVLIVLVFAIVFSSSVAALSTSDLEAAIKTCENNKATAHQMANCARALGFAEDHVIITTASQRWWSEHNRQAELQADLDAMNTPVVTPAPTPGVSNTVVPSDKYSEYPFASQVWETLKGYGYSDAVTAAIIGNMMAECGGQTLALQPFIYTKGYYGLCMWYVQYTPQIRQFGSNCKFGSDCQCSSDPNSESAIVDHQLHVLQETLEKNMELFGGDYDYFCSMENEYDAAWYFTYYYERGPWANIRGNNAMTARDYFAG